MTKGNQPPNTAAARSTSCVDMNNSEEEAELGIYSDDEDGGDDLSDNEPPIDELDTSGRPQSQVTHN